jgi:hypothetical protein
LFMSGKTGYFVLSVDSRPRVTENRVLRKVFGTESDVETGSGDRGVEMEWRQRVETGVETGSGERGWRHGVETGEWR